MTQGTSSSTSVNSSISIAAGSSSASVSSSTSSSVSSVALPAIAASVSSQTSSSMSSSSSSSSATSLTTSFSNLSVSGPTPMDIDDDEKKSVPQQMNIPHYIDPLAAAMNEVLNNRLTLTGAARLNGLSKVTLQRYIRSVRDVLNGEQSQTIGVNAEFVTEFARYIANQRR